MRLVRDDVRPVADHHARGARQRGRLDRGERRLDERRPAPARDRARARASRTRSTTSTPSRRARRCSPSLKPGGRFVATDMHEAGGVALVARELLKREPLLHGSARNVDGRSLAEIAAAVEERPGQEVVVPLEQPLKPTRRPARHLRQPRARGRDREARGPRAARPPRARRASSTPRRRASRPSRLARSSPATSS